MAMHIDDFVERAHAIGMGYLRAYDEAMSADADGDDLESLNVEWEERLRDLALAFLPQAPRAAEALAEEIFSATGLEDSPGFGFTPARVMKLTLGYV
jgi:hypothetical protein